ncbi:hypothetical protein Ciccas_013326 [Cichlidogyrus casuarinus]|uniref:Uncharacterized protein n=1 Tax=Cichlidogyrus casuarinus TaxID=1844966 RepID=A0ABD2PKV8_9PLAT
MRLAKELQGQYNSTIVEQQSINEASPVHTKMEEVISPVATPADDKVQLTVVSVSTCLVVPTFYLRHRKCALFHIFSVMRKLKICRSPRSITFIAQQASKTPLLEVSDEERTVPPLRIKLGTPETDAAGTCSPPLATSATASAQISTFNSPSQAQDDTKFKKDDDLSEQYLKVCSPSAKCILFQLPPGSKRTGRTLRSHTAALRENKDKFPSGLFISPNSLPTHVLFKSKQNRTLF